MDISCVLKSENNNNVNAFVFLLKDCLLCVSVDGLILENVVYDRLNKRHQKARSPSNSRIARPHIANSQRLSSPRNGDEDGGTPNAIRTTGQTNRKDGSSSGRQS